MFFIFFDSSVQNVLLCFGPILCVVHVCSMQNRILTQLSHAQSRIQKENVLMAHRTTLNQYGCSRLNVNVASFGLAHTHTVNISLQILSLRKTIIYIYIHIHTHTHLRAAPAADPGNNSQISQCFVLVAPWNNLIISICSSKEGGRLTYTYIHIYIYVCI